jgi:hypothetical protein
MIGIKYMLESIKQKWDYSNIAGIYINEMLQIFDGVHRLSALKTLKKEEFEEIFKSNEQEGVVVGPRINLYKDIDTSMLIFLSQSK